MTNTKGLEQSAEICIGALSQLILDHVAKYNKLQGRTPEILALAAELRMDSVFILMDLSTSYIACCKAKDPYACRYHIKNLYAGMQEAYKLLLGYKKCKQYTILTKIGNAINSKPVSDWTEQPQLAEQFHAITAKLNDLTGDGIDKTHRDLTYHYDADMKHVYQYTIAINNLEEASEKCIAYTKVLTDMIKLCDYIEKCLHKKGIATTVEFESSSIDDGLHLLLIQHLSKNKELPVVLNGILKDVKPIDNNALRLEKLNKLNDLVKENESANNKNELPEINNVIVMLNTYLTVLFMRADMAAITQSFLHSKTSGEAMLNMRRYVITITAAFSHLYGYSEDEHTKSIWSSILKMIPEDAETLKEKATQIEKQFKKVVLKNDMDVRTCYAHLYDNKTHKTNIPSIISLLKNQKPILELHKVTLMLQIINNVIVFIKDVMAELSKMAHEEKDMSTEELRNLMLKLKDSTNLLNCPIEFKAMISNMIGIVQEWTEIKL